MPRTHSPNFPIYKFPDDTIFHGIAGNNRGFTYGDFRGLLRKEEKFWHLKKRLDDYLFNSVHDIHHPFTKVSLTCVGCDVLGQILYGVHPQRGVFHSDNNNTIRIYESIEKRLTHKFSRAFQKNFDKATHRNPDNKPSSLLNNPTYSKLFHHGLRNQYIHSYRPYGVLLSDKLMKTIKIQEKGGYIIVNPLIFWDKFRNKYDLEFKRLILGTSPNSSEAEKYLTYIIG